MESTGLDIKSAFTWPPGIRVIRYCDAEEKVLRHSGTPGGVRGFTLQMDNAHLSQGKLMHSIELLGTTAIPLITNG